MTTKINKKIASYEVVKPATPEELAAKKKADEESNVIQMTEKVERPEFLQGSTYKVKNAATEHAMYITINDMVLNAGTKHEQRRPFEIFINSKNMDHFQWIVALTRIISAVFRKGGDVTFLVEEMKAVFDPRGGYWKPGGVYVPSLVAEIGQVIEQHMISIGLLKPEGLDEHQQQLVDEKRAQYEAAANKAVESAAETDGNNGFPADARLCAKCSTKAAVLLDGCMTCLNCGDSKCG